MSQPRGQADQAPDRGATASDSSGGGVIASRYPGAKNAAGVWQTILNEMPPHDVYIEPFVGSGAVLLRKRPAARSFVFDRDPAVAAHWSTIAAGGDYAGLTAIQGDARSLLAGYAEKADKHAGRVLIYCDPPYVRESRRSASPLYRFEMTDDDHRELLELLSRLNCNVMVSGYRCALYDELLGHSQTLRSGRWRRIDMRTMTRGGPAIESLWCNFTRPAALHDDRYLGANFREREQLKRKRQRWQRRLERMPILERRALLAALLELDPAESARLASDVRARSIEKRSSPETATAGGGATPQLV